MTPNSSAANTGVPTPATPVKVAYEAPDAPTGSEGLEIRIEQIFGNLPQVSGIPTYVPKTFSQSLALDITTDAIYYYDFTNNVWRKVGGTDAFIGYVDSSGSAGTPFPSGWTVTRSGTGSYVVTHDIGNTNYVFSLVPMSANVVSGSTSRANNSFEADFYDNTSGSGVNTDFMFILRTA